MKTLIFLLGILLGTSWMANAQTIEEEDPQEEYQEPEEFKSKRQKINLDEIPAPVKRGFSNSEYGSMQIVEAHVLSAEEVEKLLDGTRDILIPTEETMLYELTVEDGDHSAVLYFTEKGELYNVANEKGIG